MESPPPSPTSLPQLDNTYIFTEIALKMLLFFVSFFLWKDFAVSGPVVVNEVNIRDESFHESDCRRSVYKFRC